MYIGKSLGFEDPLHPNKVCKLQKALYRLKLALRAWFHILQHWFLNWGFVNTKSDTSLFVRRIDHSVMFVLVYVDDVVLIGSSSSKLQQFVNNLYTTFSLTDLGTLKFFSWY